MRSPVIALLLLCGLAPLLRAQDATVTIDTSQPAKLISPDLFGVFFEDINYAADGGLYAELIQNRSFEYQPTEQPSWSAFTAWQLEQRGGGKGRWVLQDAAPIHHNNPHYITLNVENPGEGVGLSNEGFDGIPLKGGEIYDFSFFAENQAPKDGPIPFTVRLETQQGECLGEAQVEVKEARWSKLTAPITAAHTCDNARFVLLAKSKGAISLDEISLFPRKTFHNRPNGLRPDLAQAIGDLHPKFIRFPGGCVAHGDGLGNIYRWKETIGPVEQRRGQENIWRYHQSVGLGYYEYFQFCEDIGAKPLPVIAAGVYCQNSNYQPGRGQKGISMEEMPAFIQDILDLVEWANGAAASPWGAKRAEAGHPEPFHLQYIGIGNEDAITPCFEERFKMIQAALQKKHPEITIIGTVGPAPDGNEFKKGWEFAREQKIPMVDEHYYQLPQWFLENLNRYDGYDRKGPNVYVGEYAVKENNRYNTLYSAIAEAAYLTGLEHNGDVVRLASYAPLLANTKHPQWKPDLIYFNNTSVFLSVNYYVQQLFATNMGDALYSTAMAGNSTQGLAVSAVKESKTGDLILKLVNPNAQTKQLHLVLSGANEFSPTATQTVLTGEPLAANSQDGPARLLPKTGNVSVRKSFDYEAPGTSLSVLRIHSKQ
jgi:alpha-L-arabinofuranosidase